jgi:hypothetical protein
MKHDAHVTLETTDLELYWIHLAYDRGQWRAHVNTKLNSSFHKKRMPNMLASQEGTLLC